MIRKEVSTDVTAGEVDEANDGVMGSALTGKVAGDVAGGCSRESRSCGECAGVGIGDGISAEDRCAKDDQGPRKPGADETYNSFEFLKIGGATFEKLTQCKDYEDVPNVLHTASQTLRKLRGLFSGM